MMARQRSPTSFNFTMSRKVNLTPNAFSTSLMSSILVSESQPSTSRAVGALGQCDVFSFENLAEYLAQVLQ